MVAVTGFPATLRSMAEGRTNSPTRTAGLFLVAVVWTVFLLSTGTPEAILFTIPVFLLAAPLAFGRYLGEDLIVRLREVSSPARAASPLVRLMDTSLVPTGIADRHSASGRAPPFAGS